MSKPTITPTFIFDNTNDEIANEKIATYLFLKAIHTSALEVIENELHKNKG